MAPALDTITDSFTVMFLDETNNQTATATATAVAPTPAKGIKAVNPVSPKSPASDSSSSSSVASEIESSLVSVHKIAELEGRHAEEPLLRENPNRFVLFPIQDADVSVCCCGWCTSLVICC
jgi:hypothetical protein